MSCKKCIHEEVCGKPKHVENYRFRDCEHFEQKNVIEGKSCEDCFLDRVCSHVSHEDARRCNAYVHADDVVEVKHGEWIEVYRNKIATVYECSCCNHLSFGTSDYCICGAKMDGKRKEK